MKLTDKVKVTIEKKLLIIEKLYNIETLFWFIRGSMYLGIYRKNSDLDILFVFRNKKGDGINAVHDITGYGFDLWGWNVNKMILTIKSSNAAINMGKAFNGLSSEYRRGNLLYYGGIFCALGNNTLHWNIENSDKIYRLLKCIFNPWVLYMEFKNDIDKILTQIEYCMPVTFCDYLNIIDELLVILHVYNNGEVGEADIKFLSDLYLPNDIKLELEGILKSYNGSLRKYDQCAYLVSLNNYIKSVSMKLDENMNFENININPEIDILEKLLVDSKLL